jgi:hypothetical protein
MMLESISLQNIELLRTKITQYSICHTVEAERIQTGSIKGVS